MGSKAIPEERASSVRVRWATALPRLDAVRRRRWLEGADRLREGSPRARRTAEEIYRALEADLDPTRSEGRTRAIHLMHHASTYDEVLFGILARFDAVVEGRDRDRGRMMAARCLGTIGRLDEAIEILEGLVGDTYLRGTPFEFEVIVSYAVLLVWQRREVELAATVAHLRRRIEAIDPREPLRRVHLARLEVFSLDFLDADPSVVEALIERMETVIDQIPEGPRFAIRKWSTAILTTIAVDRGDVVGAKLQLANFEEFGDHPTSDTWHRRDLAPVYMRIALADDDPERALEYAKWAREKHEPHRRPWNRGRIACLALEAAVRRGDLDRARAEIAVAVAIIDPPDRDPIAAGVSWRLALELARAVAKAPLIPAEEGRKIVEANLERAAHHLHRRVEAIARTAALFPYIYDSEEEDELLAYRKSFAEQYPEFRGRLARVVAAAGGHQAWSAFVDEDGSIQVCAWCLRARSSGDQWIPVGQFLDLDPKSSVSHGICSHCSRKQLTAL